MRGKRKCTVLTIILLLVFGCTFSTNGLARGNNRDSGPNTLSEEEVLDLKFMREEEKLARDTYLVLGDTWGLVIFSNISGSEQQHMDAVEKLLETYQIEDPVEDENVLGDFVNHELQKLYEDLLAWAEESMTDSLYVGAAIEETDMEDIAHAIARAEHSDIISTYENLLCGSRNHLRAFVGQIESLGEIYKPIILTQDELDAIVDTPTERDCGNTPEASARGRSF